METKFYCYFRVSTDDKGQTTEQQHEKVFAFAKQNGTIIGQCDEFASAKSIEGRPLLQKAIKVCKEQGATLLVLRLDRLARYVTDSFEIYKHVKIVTVEQDASDILTFSIFSALAQKENEIKSKRVKDKMALLKSQGRYLGNPNLKKGEDGKLSEEGKAHQAMITAKASEQRRSKANANEGQRHAYNAICFMPGTLQQKADYLNKQGYTTPNGKPFTRVQVSRLIERFGNN